MKNNYFSLVKKYIHPLSRCELCGTPAHLTIHHIIPRSKNGTNDRWNLAILCTICHNQIEECDFDTIREYRFYIYINWREYQGHEEPNNNIKFYHHSITKKSYAFGKRKNRPQRCWENNKANCIIRESIINCNCQNLFWCKANPISRKEHHEVEKIRIDRDGIRYRLVRDDKTPA
jgi:5-methylcytosine-specific restriction endonuclease McrA